MIGARQPSGLDYWSLLTATYPTLGRSKRDESWAIFLSKILFHLKASESKPRRTINFPIRFHVLFEFHVSSSQATINLFKLCQFSIQLNFYLIRSFINCYFSSLIIKAVTSPLSFSNFQKNIKSCLARGAAVRVVACRARGPGFNSRYFCMFLCPVVKSCREKLKICWYKKSCLGKKNFKSWFKSISVEAVVKEESASLVPNTTECWAFFFYFAFLVQRFYGSGVSIDCH